MIAGDMLLSTISTNVSVWSIDPEGDPLRLFLDSIARYRELPRTCWCCLRTASPSAARTGAWTARGHHRDRLDGARAIPEKPQSAAELLGCCFAGRLTHQTFFAMGEAIAHLHYLYYAGRAKRSLGNDGIMRYATGK